jgi:hypothetical protein
VDAEAVAGFAPYVALTRIAAVHSAKGRASLERRLAEVAANPYSAYWMGKCSLVSNNYAIARTPLSATKRYSDARLKRLLRIARSGKRRIT